MIIISFIQTIYSFLLKVLLDSRIDDFLRENKQKSLSKKRKPKDLITHSDIKRIIPRKYIIYNFSIYAIWLSVVFLTIISFFVSTKIKDILVDVGCFIIVAECSLVALNRVYEVIVDKCTKSWNKLLLVTTVIAVIILILFWN